MTDANEITNIVFSALSDRKGFDDWFDQIDEELQAEIKAEIAEALSALRAEPDHSEQHLEMVAAARAVVERWDTPLWKDAPATAGFINRLRDALPPAIEGNL